MYLNLHNFRVTYLENKISAFIFQDFFLNIKCKIRSLGTSTTTIIDSFIKWSNLEVKLNEKFYLGKHSIHKALCGKS